MNQRDLTDKDNKEEGIAIPVEQAIRQAQKALHELSVSQQHYQAVLERLDRLRRESSKVSTGQLHPTYVELYEKLQDLRKREEIPSELAVPITQAGKLIGVLNIESPSRLFNDDDINLLKSFAERATIALTSGQIETSESFSNIVFSSHETQTLNPHFLAASVSPYLSAITDIQHVIDEIFGRPQRETRIKSIKQESPISVSLDGAADAVQIVQNTVVPWRRKHAELMAHLSEQEKQAEIESKKAEILEKRASAAKSRAEAGKLAAEAVKQHEEAEKLKLENEKLRLDLHRAKIQLALDMLNQLAPYLSETEKIAYLVKLLPPLEVVIFSNLEIITTTNTKGAG